MADTIGQADIRGIDVQKLAVGFADEEINFEKFVAKTTTKSREIRWYQKTAGILTSTTTSGMTTVLMGDVAEKAKPTVIGPSWTRQTSYTRKFFVEAEDISIEDLKDSDPDILGTVVRDLVRAVKRQKDLRIYSVISSGAGNVVTCTSGWNSIGDPIDNIMQGMQLIREDSYNPYGAFLLLTPKDHKSLMVYLISTKGSSIPAFSSNRIEDGTVQEILGLKVFVSNHVTANEAIITPYGAAKWKSFMGLSTAMIEDPGMSKRFRVWEEGECILEEPNAVCRIHGTQIIT